MKMGWHSNLYQRILVPLDGSGAAASILPWVSLLTEPDNGTLILLHILEPDAPKTRHGEPHLTNRPAAETYLRQCQAHLAQQSLTVKPLIIPAQSPDLPEIMTQIALDEGAGLIALCTHGRGDPSRWLFGSIAQQLMSSAGLDVLALSPAGITRKPAEKLQHLLVPLDGDRGHEPALSRACTLAQHTHADLLLAYVSETLGDLDGLEAITARFSPRAFDAVLVQEREKTERYLKARAQELRGHGLEASTSILRGDPRSRLVELAASGSFDLLVLASHGHVGTDTGLVPGLAPALSLKSPIPALIVPAIIPGVH